MYTITPIDPDQDFFTKGPSQSYGNNSLNTLSTQLFPAVELIAFCYPLEAKNNIVLCHVNNNNKY